MGSVALLGMGRHGSRRGTTCSGCRRAAPAAGRPVAGGLAGLRPLGARHGGHHLARARVARPVEALAAALGGRGRLGAAGGPARLHAARRGALRAGVAGRGPGEPARRAGRRPGHRARPRRGSRRAGLGRRSAVGSPLRRPGAPRGSSPSRCTAPTCPWPLSRGRPGRPGSPCSPSSVSCSASSRAPSWPDGPARSRWASVMVVRAAGAAAHPGLAAATAGCWWPATSGQGDGLVLNAGPRHRGRRGHRSRPGVRWIGCLHRLDVERVAARGAHPLPRRPRRRAGGVLRGRGSRAIEVTSLADPVVGRRLGVGAGGPVRGAGAASRRTARPARVGPLTWQVVAPSHQPSAGSESPPNDASLVLLVQTRGIRILLMGDEEDGSQAQLMRDTGGVRADVLKVAHHGSARQDPDLVRSTGARLAVISVGRRQRLRPPGAVAARAAPRCGDAGGAHRPGRRRRGRRRRGLRVAERGGASAGVDDDRLVRVATYSFSQVDVFGSRAAGRQPRGGGPRRDRSRRRPDGGVRAVDQPLGDDLPAAADGPGRRLPPADLHPGEELPFAGHPTLGSAHAWLEAGGVAASADRVVQECGLGLVELRRDGDTLAFPAPDFLRSRTGRRGDPRPGRRSPRHRGATAARRLVDRQRTGLARAGARQRRRRSSSLRPDFAALHVDSSA